MNYNKNSVKLLSVIEKFENKVVLYTEFDGNYGVGDKLYIMVIDSGSTDYVLDSFQYSGNTYRSIGYELLNKEGNKLTLDIDYELTLGTGSTILTYGNCYIGRVYVKYGEIYSGVMNGSLLYDVSILPKNNLSLIWYQGILATSEDNIQYIDFNTNNAGNLLLKSELLNNGTINSYYTINNYNNGLTIINLLGDSTNPLLLFMCNINSGVFNYCDVDGKSNSINNGILNNSHIRKTYIVNGGDFIDCILDSGVIWMNGTWDSSWTGATPTITTNPFRISSWANGTWRNGIFPTPRTWVNGRFVKGVFNGKVWYNGQFGTKDSTFADSGTSDTIFGPAGTSSWINGSFNGGLMINSAWKGGNWYNGKFQNSTWHDGTFNGGILSGSTWYNGTFNNGNIYSSTWINGTFNNGTIYSSTWEDGNFNNGGITDKCTWINGNFFGGKFENSEWQNGNFYKGSMFGSDWIDGNLYYGLMNSVNWTGGTWHNGIANSINFYDGIWNNGVFNFGYFYKGQWYDGAFNSGFFTGETNSIWYGGNFYFGAFGGVWSGGTFYTGKIETTIPQKDIINREFVQYNKSGLIFNKYSTVKLPAKKKY